ncbi:kinase-like domain-containing protein [Vararia minispora EC-137]|uniref:Kinase-like domain-containing protein n=1 Tax=Vararia minispora EC-137 TaxID=1314806 RepID=A0ACB8QFH8_9AGAM|nr:kinase-like domain-containing protein [Vararia minispora EC-137]
MFAAATSFFSRSNISQNYNIGTPTVASSAQRSPTPSTSSSSSTLPAVAHVPAFQVGLWRVQSASHKTTNKRVSVWTFDKRNAEMDRMTPAARENTLEVLKAEAASLSKLRHPSILEVVEPLEDTRSELIFATEPLLSSLYLAIPGSPYASKLVDLDEVEIQKGILQLCKGLQFLHQSARLIHSNINPESILINNSGDWKIGGLGQTIALSPPDGSKPRWEFPSFDSRLPPYTQRSFDYMAPEYALDEVLNTASDMYSLGCLVFAVHLKGDPPFKNFGGLGALRENAGKPLTGMDRLDRDLQAMLRMLITRHHTGRMSPDALPSHSFFSSLPISTLNFLERSNFATKSREEKVSFMKGLTGVLDRFSEGLRIRKILPSMLEEMKDTHLLPYILPNIFLISKIISSQQFASLVLPSLKPLFIVKDPPQNMLTLLDNLETLQSKTEKNVFREHVLPLVYNALESEHAVVQERALQAVPDLCETIDYAEVQGVLFPRVAIVFTRTRILSVKVATLVTFLAMVKTLDQTSLTQKLVPLLSKIRTKEPAVMMATLSVQEAMGLKVDREAVATLVLPQLWAMCIGPLINVDQFQRFMAVIKKLSERVEREHNQFLRDSQRIEDKSAIQVNGGAPVRASGSVDFESLVASTNGATIKADTTLESNAGWDDDVWGSILAPSADTPRVHSPALSPAAPVAPSFAAASYPQVSSPSRLVPPSSVTTTSTARTSIRPSGPLGARRITSTSSTPLQPSSPPATSSFNQPPPNGMLRPSMTGSSVSSNQLTGQPLAPPKPKPNYNISLTEVSGSLNASIPPLGGAFGAQPVFTSPPAGFAPVPSSFASSSSSFTSSAPTFVVNPALTPSVPHLASPPLFASRPAMDVLTPSKPARQWGTGANQTDLDDFDPLK